MSSAAVYEGDLSMHKLNEFRKPASFIGHVENAEVYGNGSTEVRRKAAYRYLVRDYAL